MSVSLRPHRSDQGLPLTAAQERTVARFSRRHPKARGYVTARGRHSGFCSIVVQGLDSASSPTLDAEGYVVAWCGSDRGWRRLDSPINPGPV